VRIEQEVLKENVGIQDQIATAFGGINRVDIKTTGDFGVTPVPLSGQRIDELERHLMLIYTGVARNASAVAGQKIQAIPRKQAELHAMRQMVDDACRLLTEGGDLLDFGRLLHESWQLKRSLAPGIAPGFVDEVYERGRKAGAVGGKLLGAGGGGFMLFFVKPEDRQRMLDALHDLLCIPFEFESFGTQIIFNDPQTLTRTSMRKRDFKR